MIKIISDYLLRNIVETARELKRFPSLEDLKLKAWNNTSFPNYQAFEALGDHQLRVLKTRLFCEENKFNDILQYCPITEKNTALIQGTVYMYKAKNFYKIGRTIDIDRRDREIKLQLPFDAQLIHRIETDDPTGIEKYWHNRFSSKRQNGEWFCLTDEDVAAFKRRVFM